MKNSLQHLPEKKQEEIRTITEDIVSMVKPEMVILFGSYAGNNWVEDTYVEDGITHTYKSDYDIFVVTEKPQDMPLGFSKKVRRRIRRSGWLAIPVSIIFHDINFLNTELEEGQYFFVELIETGIMLYNTGKYQLATPKILSSAERANKAKIYFDNWLKNATIFFESSVHNFKKGKEDQDYYQVAIFELHQATERYFMTILLVFTDYKPRTHDLDDLNKQAGNADIRFKTVFPNQTEEEKRKFILLVKAYIDSRYKIGYTIAPEDLEWLTSRVQKLKELTETICLERIEEYRKG